MTPTATLVIRPSRSGYVFAGILLLMAVILLAIIQFRGSVHRLSEAILAWLVVGGVVLFAIGNFLSTAVAKVVVDGDTVQVHDWLRGRRRFARAEVSHAAMRSVYTPTTYGAFQQNAFLLVGRNGRCLVRLPESDYGTEALKRLVETLGLNWPHTQHANLLKINREFPGAYPIDLQTVTIAVIILLALAVAGAAIAGRFG